MRNLTSRRTGASLHDRFLGMHVPIPRRDFLNGLAVGMGAALLSPRELLALADDFAPEKAPGYYPPALTGLRGSPPGSFEARGVWRDNPDFLKVFDQGLAKAGPRGAMRAVAQLLDSRSGSRRVSAMGVAAFYARAGDADSAMKWLERAYQEREVMMPHVRFDPEYDTLHSDPRFRDLLRRMKFPR